ncbi:hypothetical protein [Streptomyces sp. NPDC087270]|uniref:hypothetical protein n=1 Tax=Streptomyces sp. NPDC087270 TaxID=3365774 RepID=UPI003817C569
MSERKPYRSDVSDERWALVEPVIAAWKAAHPSVRAIRAGTRLADLGILTETEPGLFTQPRPQPTDVVTTCPLVPHETNNRAQSLILPSRS